MLVTLLSAIISYTPLIIVPPEQPLPGDPDLAFVTDQRLKNLYLNTVISLRKAQYHGLKREIEISSEWYKSHEPGIILPEELRFELEQIKQLREIEIEKVRSTRLGENDTRFITDKMLTALQEIPINWHTFRAGFWIAKIHRIYTNELFYLVEFVLTISRGDKISDAHAMAIQETIEFLGESHTEEALGILVKATEAEFWTDGGPVRSHLISSDSDRSILQLRHKAVGEISRAPASLCLPILEQLWSIYPGHDHGPWQYPYTFEESIGGTLDVIIYNIKKREGLPVDHNPLEEAAAQMRMKLNRQE